MAGEDVVPSGGQAPGVHGAAAWTALYSVGNERHLVCGVAVEWQAVSGCQRRSKTEPRWLWLPGFGLGLWHDAALPLVAEPVAVAADLHDGRMVHQPVEHRGRQHSVTR